MSLPTQPEREFGSPGPDVGRVVRNIFILDSRPWFESCRHLFDPDQDIVLTYDLALKLEVEHLGGQAWFVDHLVERSLMQENSWRTYEFFRTWNLDGQGKDIFSYAGVPFGFSFRIEFWSELLFFVRARLCLERLRDLRFRAVYAGTSVGLLEEILDDMGIAFSPVRPDEASALPRYYFPIHAWMSENVRREGWASRLKKVYAWSVGTLLSWADRIRRLDARTPLVFVQEYHPTRALIARLQRDGRVRISAAAVSRAIIWARFIPLWSRVAQFRPIATQLMGKFRSDGCARLVLTGGVDVTDRANRLIEQRIVGRVAESVRVVHCVQRHLDRSPMGLLLLIANIGDTVTLVDCVAKARGIPSYLIINGLMMGSYQDESKYATVINVYSRSIKEHYFRGMDNIVCLGDPRMDEYPPAARHRSSAAGAFEVTIGASGYNNTELNSYVAVEFDFLHDVLTAIGRVRAQGVALRVVIKVRANGYREQYEAFVAEFFPGIVDEIVDQIPMRELLQRTDFFVSIYSQTLFEASCLGIPCVYYKKDNEVLDPPFDGKSELVTVASVDDLVMALDDARVGHPRFEPFLRRDVMEQFVGPLDGHNVD